MGGGQGNGKVFTDDYPWFTPRELERSPSVRHGMPAAEERRRRHEAARQIRQLGQALKMNVVTIGTASVYFHVFYARRPLQTEAPAAHGAVGGKVDGVLATVAACVVLAGKVEEDRRSADHVVTEFFKVVAREIPSDEGRSAARAAMLARELQVLETIEYSFDLRHPYKELNAMCRDAYGSETGRVLDPAGNAAKTVGKVREVAQLFLNDTFSTNLCLVFSPRAVAAAGFWLAHRYLAVPQPLVATAAGGAEFVPWNEHWRVGMDAIRRISVETAMSAGDEKMRGNMMKLASEEEDPVPPARYTLPAGAWRHNPLAPLARPPPETRAPPTSAAGRKRTAEDGGAAQASGGKRRRPGPDEAAATEARAAAAQTPAKVHPCPRCGKMLDKAQYDVHKVACKERYGHCIPCGPYLKGEEAKHADCKDRCKICGRRMLATALPGHSARCKIRSSKKGKDRKSDGEGAQKSK